MRWVIVPNHKPHAVWRAKGEERFGDGVCPRLDVSTYLNPVSIRHSCRPTLQPTESGFRVGSGVRQGRGRRGGGIMGRTGGSPRDKWLKPIFPHSPPVPSLLLLLLQRIGISQASSSRVPRPSQLGVPVQIIAGWYPLPQVPQFRHILDIATVEGGAEQSGTDRRAPAAQGMQAPHRFRGLSPAQPGLLHRQLLTSQPQRVDPSLHQPHPSPGIDSTETPKACIS